MPEEQAKDFKVCVPLEERPRNNVDKHYKYIEDIQYCCSHDFRFLEPPELRESKVPGVFIIFQADWGGVAGPEEVKLQCLYCSLEKVWVPLHLCPKCLYEGEFKKSELQRREIYFGEGYGYYRARPCSCPKCGFQIVADEWDQ